MVHHDRFACDTLTSRQCVLEMERFDCHQSLQGLQPELFQTVMIRGGHRCALLGESESFTKQAAMHETHDEVMRTQKVLVEAACLSCEDPQFLRCATTSRVVGCAV